MTAYHRVQQTNLGFVQQFLGVGDGVGGAPDEPGRGVAHVDHAEVGGDQRRHLSPLVRVVLLARVRLLVVLYHLKENLVGKFLLC